MTNFAINPTRNLEKAKLIEISWQENGTVHLHLGHQMAVQFNPASLKVSASNKVEIDVQNSPSGLQICGQNTSSLSLELLFDVSGADATHTQDVRQMSGRIAAFLQSPESSQAQKSEGQEKPDVVPGVRFHWGAFIFDGVLQSMDETLDFWSEDGRPLRSTVAISLTGIHHRPGSNPDATVAPSEQQGIGAAGTLRPTPSPEGKSLQSIVAGAGLKTDWKAIAAQNGIENPRHIATGTLLNLQGTAKATVKAIASARAGPRSPTPLTPFEEAKRLAQRHARTALTGSGLPLPASGSAYF